jgi:hypothetical protein
MNSTAGGYFRKTPSGVIDDGESLTWPMALFLVLLGVGAVALPTMLRLPLKLPGHQGLVWMALLMSGRTVSRYRWAASISGVGAGLTALLPLWGSDDPIFWLTYLVPSLVIDAGLPLAQRWRMQPWSLAVLAGLAHGTKPLLRLVFGALAGWPYGSLLGGVLYPLTLHILFGAIGGLIGIGAGVLSTRRR